LLKSASNKLHIWPCQGTTQEWPSQNGQSWRNSQLCSQRPVLLTIYNGKIYEFINIRPRR